MLSAQTLTTILNVALQKLRVNEIRHFFFRFSSKV